MLKVNEKEFNKIYAEALKKANSFTYNYADSIMAEDDPVIPTPVEVAQSKLCVKYEDLLPLSSEEKDKKSVFFSSKKTSERCHRQKMPISSPADSPLEDTKPIEGSVKIKRSKKG